MQLNPRSLTTRVTAAVGVLALGVGLAVVPALSATAGTAGARTATAAECSSAQAALHQAQQQKAAAHRAVVKARKALKKAKKAHHGKAAKVKKAKKVLARADKRYGTANKGVQYRTSRARYACASPTSDTSANSAGRVLGLLALANGLDITAIDASQLTTLLDKLLPGVSDELSPSQLTALLAGFNALGGGDVDPTDLLAQLPSSFSPADIAALLAGAADPSVLEAVFSQILGQLSGLASGFPVPGSFDPTDLLATFAGVFGQLDPTQFGDLLVLLTRATGTAGSTFTLDQLTSMLDTLAPGASDAFGPADLTTMLAVLNGHAASEALLANLLGGQFTPQQLSSVMNGSAPTALVGAVFAQVMAQFATAGAGGLELPSGFDLSTLTNLVSTVTDLFGVLTGGGVLPVICGIIPLPGLCP